MPEGSTAIVHAFDQDAVAAVGSFTRNDLFAVPPPANRCLPTSNAQSEELLDVPDKAMAWRVRSEAIRRDVLKAMDL